MIGFAPALACAGGGGGRLGVPSPSCFSAWCRAANSLRSKRASWGENCSLLAYLGSLHLVSSLMQINFPAFKIPCLRFNTSSLCIERDRVWALILVRVGLWCRVGVGMFWGASGAWGQPVGDKYRLAALGAPVLRLGCVVWLLPRGENGKIVFFGGWSSEQVFLQVQVRYSFHKQPDMRVLDISIITTISGSEVVWLLCKYTLLSVWNPKYF